MKRFAQQNQLSGRCMIINRNRPVSRRIKPPPPKIGTHCISAENLIGPGDRRRRNKLWRLAEFVGYQQLDNCTPNCSSALDTNNHKLTVKLSTDFRVTENFGNNLASILQLFTTYKLLTDTTIGLLLHGKYLLFTILTSHSF